MQKRTRLPQKTLPVEAPVILEVKDKGGANLAVKRIDRGVMANLTPKVDAASLRADLREHFIRFRNRRNR